MDKPQITLCADGYYRRVIYGLGPYIADYPEQALLLCIVQGWCCGCFAPPDDLDGAPADPRDCEVVDDLMAAYTDAEVWDTWGVIADVIPFTADFPRADIHHLISPDILHQIVKGTFKDHLVDWVESYINLHHSAAEAK